MTEHRVALLKDQEGLIQAEDPAAIVAGLPYIRVDEGNGAFAGRRKRLRLKRDSAHVTLRARNRPLPPDPGNGSVLVQWAVDYANRRIPVCCADPRTRTIHLLVELGRAEIVDAATGIDPVAMLVDSFFAETVAAWLKDAEEPRVGREVGRHLRSLLVAQPQERRALLNGELSFLERLASSEVLPQALADRIELLRCSLQSSARTKAAAKAGRQVVDREISRLERLVASRACGALRFSEGEILGLLNPRRLGQGWSVKPLIFRLQLLRPRYRPVLSIWNPGGSEAGRGNARCLGEGDLVIRELMGCGDVYGLVDVVLNFVETNQVGAVPLDRNRGRGTGYFFDE